MPNEGLEKFHQLVLKLRSEAISNISNHISGKFRTFRSFQMAEEYKRMIDSPDIFESYFLPEIFDETMIILMQLLDRSRFDIQYVMKESVLLFEMTESLGAACEFDWLPQVKPKK